MEAAQAEAQRALEMNREMGYYWGQKDTEEVLQGFGTSRDFLKAHHTINRVVEVEYGGSSAA